MIQRQTTAVILAGGLGTRLRTIVADKPKVMALVNGRPFLEYLLDQLIDNGIQRIVICTGYKGDQIQACFGHTYRHRELIYSHEKEPLGTGGALRLAAKFLGSEPTLIINGDSFCKFDYNDFVEFHVVKKAKISIGVVQVPDVSRYGAVQLDDSARVLEFSEKGHYRGDGLINAGLYLIDSDVIISTQPDTNFSLERELFPGYIDGSLYGFRLFHNFIDIGVPLDYAAAQHFFR